MPKRKRHARRAPQFMVMAMDKRLLAQFFQAVETLHHVTEELTELLDRVRATVGPRKPSGTSTNGTTSKARPSKTGEA